MAPKGNTTKEALTSEQLIAKFKELQHFLTDVWDWKELHVIGWRLQHMWEAEYYQHANILLQERELNGVLAEHLGTRYANAVIKVDELFAEVESYELSTVLIELLHSRVTALENVEIQYGHATRGDDDTDPFQDHEPSDAEIERLYEPGELERPRNAWGNVTKDVSFYVNKVAIRIDRLRTKMNPTKDESSSMGSSAEPIKWKGSVQVLAWLLRELAEKDWIDVPRHRHDIPARSISKGTVNASQCAKNLAPHFHEVKAITLEQELKPEGGTVGIDDVRDFNVPMRAV